MPRRVDVASVTKRAPNGRPTQELLECGHLIDVTNQQRAMQSRMCQECPTLLMGRRRL